VVESGNETGDGLGGIDVEIVWGKKKYKGGGI